MSLTITPAAAQHIAGYDGHLRVRIKSGGCSGLKTLFTFEKETRKDDMVFHDSGASVIIDPLSFSFVKGAILDYKDEMMASQFVLTHPNASSQCGCGESFSIA